MNRKSYLAFLIAFTIGLLLLIRILPRYDEIKPGRTHFQKEELEVTSLQDHGENTLRKAIIEADAAQRKITIRLKASGTVVMETPLPVLINDNTTIIAEGSVTIDASRLPKDDFFWTIKASDSSISGVRFLGKGNKGLLILSDKGLVEKCSFEGFDTGITIIGNRVTVKDSTFINNKKGIDVTEAARHTDVSDNKFNRNLEAGLWAVWPGAIEKSPAFLKVERNNLSGNSIGILLALSGAEIKNNILTNNTKGIYLLNAVNIRLEQNDIHQNKEHGILMENAIKNLLNGNSIYQNNVSGILMKGSAGNLIQENQIFSNVNYGVVEVLTDLKTSLLPNQIRNNLIRDNGIGIRIIASSPLLKGNTIKDNRASDIKIEDYEVAGKRYRAIPLIEGEK